MAAIKKLGEVCVITMGQSPCSESYNDIGKGMPFFQGCSDFGKLNPHITTYCDMPKKTADINDVLISVRAPIGTLNIADIECCIGRGLASIREIDGITCYKYLYYFLLKSKKELQEQGIGVTFKAIGKDVLFNFPIVVPPLSEQSRIVEELDLLSNIIEKKRQQLSELDNLAQSIFYDMFGDPVTNEKGWEVKKLGEVYAINPSKKITLIGIEGDDMVSFLPMEDLPIKACYVTPKQNRTCNEVMSSYTCFANNDVLLAKVTPCFENGKVGIASNLINGVGFGSSEFIVIRPKELAVKEYVYHLVQTDNFVEKACKQFTGTSGLRRVPKQFVEQLKIGIPPLSLQQLFAQKIEAIEQQKALIKQSIAETEELFNSRMDYYFS